MLDKKLFINIIIKYAKKILNTIASFYTNNSQILFFPNFILLFLFNFFNKFAFRDTPNGRKLSVGPPDVESSLEDTADLKFKI